MSDVDLYILRFDPEVQARLAFIRQTAGNVFDDAEERLYHGVPSLFHNGRDFMNYGAYQNHISIHVGYAWADFLRRQYPQFKYTKTTITFQHEELFPEDIVQVICGLLKPGLHNGGQ